MSPNNFSGLEMPCDQVKHALLLLVDGRDFFEANEIDPISVDKHLERCAPCKLEVEAEKMVHQLMQSRSEEHTSELQSH